MFQQNKKGIEEYLEEIVDLVDFFKNPEKYEEIGATLPKGILMIGAPGVGKTLLAKALAGESNCAFEYISTSTLQQPYQGSGTREIQEIFERARKNSPCIIFFDEFDSIAGNRTFDQDGVIKGVLNQILIEMDGFKKNEKIFVIAATNFPDSLDPAIVRPGRFDKILSIPTPSIKGRKEIIEYYLQKISFNKQISSQELASLTINFTGADIKTFINLAILSALKNKRQMAEYEDFDFALDRMNLGVFNKSLKITEEEKYMTAIHEAGHAMVSILNPKAIPMNKVTILSKGGSLG